MFDTIGTLIGVTQEAGLRKMASSHTLVAPMTADATGTICGACLGTSTVTSYVESAAGVEAGGRTGLTAIFTAFCFLAALFFAPLVELVGSYPPITAPALVLVGAMMVRNVREIEWQTPGESTPGVSDVDRDSTSHFPLATASPSAWSRTWPSICWRDARVLTPTLVDSRGSDRGLLCLYPSQHLMRIYCQPNATKLPAGVGGKEVAISGANVIRRSRARPAPQYILVAHKLAVVFADRPRCWLITGIGGVGAGRPLPNVAKHLR